MYFSQITYIIYIGKLLFYGKGCDYMNITSLSSTNISLTGTSDMNAIDMSMLKKTLDTVEANGDMLTKMMEQSVNPFLGTNIDIRL